MNEAMPVDNPTNKHKSKKYLEEIISGLEKKNTSLHPDQSFETFNNALKDFFGPRSKTQDPTAYIRNILLAERALPISDRMIYARRYGDVPLALALLKPTEIDEDLLNSLFYSIFFFVKNYSSRALSTILENKNQLKERNRMDELKKIYENLEAILMLLPENIHAREAVWRIEKLLSNEAYLLHYRIASARKWLAQPPYIYSTLPLDEYNKKFKEMVEVTSRPSISFIALNHYYDTELLDLLENKNNQVSKLFSIFIGFGTISYILEAVDRELKLSQKELLSTLKYGNYGPLELVDKVTNVRESHKHLLWEIISSAGRLKEKVIKHGEEPFFYLFYNLERLPHKNLWNQIEVFLRNYKKLDANSKKVLRRWLPNINTLEARVKFLHLYNQGIISGSKMPSIVESLNQGLNYKEALELGSLKTKKSEILSYKEKKQYARELALIKAIETYEKFGISSSEFEKLFNTNEMEPIKSQHNIFYAYSALTKKHALKLFLGLSGYREFIKHLLDGLLPDIKRIFGQKSELEDILRDPELCMTREQGVEIFSTNPSFILEIFVPNKRKKIQLFVKLYDFAYRNSENDTFEKEVENTALINRHLKKQRVTTARILAQIPNPIKAKNQKNYRTNIWGFVEGECAYRRLNGWLGNKRIIMSEEEKHSYFKKAIDQLALIHYYGMRIKGLKRPYENDKNYFTNRIVKIMFGKLENEIGIKIEEGFIHEFINHYQAINDALVELSKIFPGYYKDAAPRNDIITSNGEIIPVDFESSRILYRGLDIISKLEAGWDFPEDDIATVYLGDLVNENEFQNLVLRYILRYESVKLSEEYKHRRGKTRNVLEEKIKSLDEILKNRDLDEYGSYEKAANEARVLPDNYILFLDTVRSLARIQRHFEYTGYSARDIREAIRRKDKFGIDVNIRAVNYHLEKALGGLYWFAEPKTWNMRLSQPFINEVYIAAPKLYKLAEPLLNILDIKQIKDTVKQKFVV